MSFEVDYIVVGAGSAGCVRANRLSEDPNIRVLLLEAGGPDNNPWIHIPVGYFKTMHNPAFDWCYRTEPDAGIAGRQLQWPRGKVLGGSSSAQRPALRARTAPGLRPAGPRSAIRAGATTTCCPTSGSRKTRSAARMHTTAWAVH